MEIPKFKIRCSEIYKIMGESKGSSITEKQLKELVELQKKAVNKVLTEKQRLRVDELISKRDAPPQLSEGAKTYCQEWLIERLTGRVKEVETREIKKGNLCEEIAMKYVDPESEKNTSYFDSEYMTGTCDVLYPEMIRDIKCAFDVWSMPYFDNGPKSAYYWQAQGYMWGYNRKKYELCHVLVDTPEFLLYDWEKPLVCKDLPRWLRVKTFEMERDEDTFDKIADKVDLCREYIRELVYRLQYAG